MSKCFESGSEGPVFFGPPGSASVSVGQRYESEDPHPDPYQNVTDPQHCCTLIYLQSLWNVALAVLVISGTQHCQLEASVFSDNPLVTAELREKSGEMCKKTVPGWGRWAADRAGPPAAGSYTCHNCTPASCSHTSPVKKRACFTRRLWVIIPLLII